MQYLWRRREPGATKVIVFFGGWGIGPEAYSHLDMESDLLTVWDYRDLNRELPEILHYDSRTLVAWSFGVASYCLWQQNWPDVFTRKVAINGTMTPIDRRTGIPPVVVEKTIDTLSEESFKFFVARCYGQKQLFSPIDVAELKTELIAINNRDYSTAKQTWDRVWVSRQDKIFPFANMQRAWQQPIDIIDKPHVPFTAWTSWEEIVSCP